MTKMVKRLKKILLRLVVSTFLVSAFFVLTQDLQVFPGTIQSLFLSKQSPPTGTEDFKITTADGEQIHIWRKVGEGLIKKQVVLLLHGNAERLSTVAFVQGWLAKLGFTSYVVEYRGYPGSTGFPSEQGVYLDGEAAINLLLEKERLTAQDVIVWGNSIGTGIATYLAQKYVVGTLVLIAPYTSIPDVAESLPLFGYLKYFLWYNFPNEKNISQLTDTCVVAAHGETDTVIPYQHSQQLKEAYKGSHSYTLISSEKAGHNDIIGIKRNEIMEAVDECLGKQ